MNDCSARMYVCMREREREYGIVSFYVQRGDVVLFERERERECVRVWGECYEEEEDEVRVIRE